jgi:hypothetical protein
MNSGDPLHSANEPDASELVEASDLVTIRQFGDISEALLAKGCLESAGIEGFLADLNVSRVDWPITRGIRLQVNAGDAEAAIELLDQSAADSKV